jgi:hypothetical protein
VLGEIIADAVEGKDNRCWINSDGDRKCARERHRCGTLEGKTVARSMTAECACSTVGSSQTNDTSLAWAQAQRLCPRDAWTTTGGRWPGSLHEFDWSIR